MLLGEDHLLFDKEAEKVDILAAVLIPLKGDDVVLDVIVGTLEVLIGEHGLTEDGDDVATVVLDHVRGETVKVIESAHD